MIVLVSLLLAFWNWADGGRRSAVASARSSLSPASFLARRVQV
ncbi:hypothetical protein ACFQQB_40685 [Nonomuraea rubra]